MFVLISDARNFETHSECSQIPEPDGDTCSTAHMHHFTTRMMNPVYNQDDESSLYQELQQMECDLKGWS